MTPKEIAERLRAAECYVEAHGEPCRSMTAKAGCLCATAADLIERLTAPASEGEVERARLATAENEIKHLRTALQQIIAGADSDGVVTAWDGADIARAALGYRKSEPA